MLTDKLKKFQHEQFKLFILAMPATAGFLTLIHYASLLRITSIGFFCVLIAMFLQDYLKSISLFNQDSLHPVDQ